jgi:hypothetical protein
MTITQEGFTRFRKSTDTNVLLLDWNQIILVTEKHQTSLLFRQDGVTVAIRELPAIHNGDTIIIDGKMRGTLEVEVSQNL